MRQFLFEFPGWLFLVILVYAPWAYGCTREWSISLLNQFVVATLAWWLVVCAVRNQRIRVHPYLLAGSIFLAIQGWFMIWNAQYFYDRFDLKFVPVPCLWSTGPGVLDRVEAIPTMLRMTGMLGVMCFISDLTQRPEWRLRVWRTVALCGVSIVIFGLSRDVMGLKLLGADLTSIGWTSFATYYYHANAGAFVNLILPVVIGFCVMSFRNPDQQLARSVWVPSVVLCLAGAVCTTSKAALGIACVLVLTLAVWQVRYHWQKGAWRSKRSLLLTVGGSILLLPLIAALGWADAAKRWAELPELLGRDYPRLLTVQTCLNMLPDAGAWGFGPGNFKIAFPHYTNTLGSKVEGTWLFAHNDYLQTAIEWGWVGASVWAIILFGGMSAGLRTYLSGRGQIGRRDRVMLFVTVVALAGMALHAAIDFPLQIASLQLYAAAFLGICWGSRTWAR